MRRISDLSRLVRSKLKRSEGDVHMRVLHIAHLLLTRLERSEDDTHVPLAEFGGRSLQTWLEWAMAAGGCLFVKPHW